MKLYPIRTTRDKWFISIFSHHQCNISCETLVEHIEDFISLSRNPYYNVKSNLCHRCKSHEKSGIHLYSFDRNNPICENGSKVVDPDEIVIPDKTFSLMIHFPLSYMLSVEIHTSQMLTRKDLIYAIKSLYQFIYEEEERTATPQLFRLNRICSKCNLNTLSEHTEEVKEEKEECSVCYSNMESDSIKLRCSHVFHKMCISRWMKTSPTCPICRSSIFVCSKCDGTGVVFYYFTGVVVPIEERDGLDRNLSNGIFGIHSYDFESLILGDMFYDRINRILKIDMYT